MIEYLSHIRRNLVQYLLYLMIMVGTLLVVSLVVFMNATSETTSTNMTERVQVIVYLDNNISGHRQNEIETHLAKIENIHQIEFVSSEDTLEQFLENITIEPEVFELLGENPLNDMLTVSLHDISDIETTYREMIEHNYLSEDNVVYSEDGYNLIASLNQGNTTISFVLGIMLMTITLPIINILIKNSIDARATEIYIKRIIGATRLNILKPIIWELITLYAFSYVIFLSLNYFVLEAVIQILENLNISILTLADIDSVYLQSAVIGLVVGIVFITLQLLYVAFRKINV